MDDIFGMAVMAIVLFLFVLIVVWIVERARSSRYHETDTVSDERTIADFGMPVRTLYTSSKILTLHNQIDITDENEEPVYQSTTKFLSLHDRTQIYRANGGKVADISRKFFTLHEKHFIEMADGKSFTIASELWHIAKDIIHVEELGWTINGHILHMNYYISDRRGNVVGVVGE